MQGKYIFCALIVIFLICAPGAASTKKIAKGSPVFIGEADLDISSAIKDCHAIGWWPDEKNMTGPAVKNITIQDVNEVILPVNHFNVSPDLFGGYTGNWYCEDKKPFFVVLTVLDPEISIRVWDVDSNKDITGQTVPVTKNITYRIDTNLQQVLSYKNRTELNPGDGFFTVTLTTPSGKELKNIYTGSVGATSTQILMLDNNPFLTVPTYFGPNIEYWNRQAKDASGSLLYPPGTYTFTVTQNLNHMMDAYPSSGNINNGKTSSSASVAFTPQNIVATPAGTTIQGNITTVPVPETTIATIEHTVVPSLTVTESPVETKTTYSPLPAWVIIGSLIAALCIAVRSRK